jgi:hypothetical protein
MGATTLSHIQTCIQTLLLMPLPLSSPPPPSLHTHKTEVHTQGCAAHLQSRQCRALAARCEGGWAAACPPSAPSPPAVAQPGAAWEEGAESICKAVSGNGPPFPPAPPLPRYSANLWRTHTDPTSPNIRSATRPSPPTTNGDAVCQGMSQVSTSHITTPKAKTSAAGVACWPSNSSGASQRGLLAPPTLEARLPSITLLRLKSATWTWGWKGGGRGWGGGGVGGACREVAGGWGGEG